MGGGLLLSLGGLEVYRLFKTPSFTSLEEHRELLADLADTIIPATDSPGAKEAGTGEFIIKMIRDCTDRKTQNKFIDGLDSLAAYTKHHYNKSFTQCRREEKEAILRHFELSGKPTLHGVAGKAEQRLLGESFFTVLKKYTVLGYCTSRQGATQALRYDYIPGKYTGRIPLMPNQKAWATQ